MAVDPNSLSANGQCHSSRIKTCFRKSFAQNIIFRKSFAGVLSENISQNLSPQYNFAGSEKILRGVSCWNPGGLRNEQSLHGRLD